MKSTIKYIRISEDNRQIIVVPTGEGKEECRIAIDKAGYPSLKIEKGIEKIGTQSFFAYLINFTGVESIIYSEIKTSEKNNNILVYAFTTSENRYQFEFPKKI